MAIELPQSSGNIHPEYAATSIQFNRQIYNISGVLTPVFTANISYERKDYLVDNNGNKIGLISTDVGMMSNPLNVAQNTRTGNIFIPVEQIAVMFNKLPEPDKSIGEIIANAADELIRQDLIAKGIITE